MSLTLTSADLARCEAALTTLLSPLEHETPASWGDAVMRACIALTGADRALFGLPIPDDVLVKGSTRDAEAALDPYLRYFITVDHAFIERRKALGVEVYDLATLYEPGETDRDELYNDWCRPNGLCDTLGMGFEVGAPIPACVQLYHDDGIDGFGERGRALLRLLLPAFKAGVNTSRALAEHRRALLRTLDTVPQGLLLYDARARVLHANPTARAILTAPEATRVSAELERVARSVIGLTQVRRRSARTPAPPVQAERVVRTAEACYRVSATTAGPELERGGIAALVLVVPTEPPGLSPAAARERYGLTPRELGVARLIAAGYSTAALAAELGISRHTARRHTENILRKLGVHSKAAVGMKLFGVRDTA